MSENQRAFFAFDVAVPTVVRQLDAAGEAWDEFGGETIDLSAGGVLLAGSEPAPEQHLVEVVLRSGEPPLDVTARGRVVRSDRAADGAWLSAVRFETGVELAFGEVPRADRAAINRLVIAEERKQPPDLRVTFWGRGETIPRNRTRCGGGCDVSRLTRISR
jgi:hypothetical protein